MSSHAAADVARVLQKIAVRAFVLAFFFGIMGEALVAMALALAGFGLLFTPLRQGPVR